MPGRTPPEAYAAFIGPIQNAVSCLGPVKVVTSPKGRNTPNMDHAWTLNSSRGFSVAGWHFSADMNYRIVQDPSGDLPWRVRTLAYRYRLAVLGDDIFRVHWHPVGRSPIKYPHVHANLSPSQKLSSSLDAHLETDRMSLERSLRWAFSLGMPAARPDWEERLIEIEQPHLQYRTWESGGPPESTGTVSP